MRLFLKILWWFTFVFLALIFIALYYREWIAEQVVERQIRNSLGLEAEIGNLSFSLLEPKMTFYNLKLYNSPDFNSSLFLDMPELHIEYDPAALRRHKLHITLMRVNINELDVVRNGGNVTNIFVVARLVAPLKSGAAPGRWYEPFKDYQFAGIDLLNISIGTAKFIDLKNHLHDRSVALGIRDQSISNIKSSADLASYESLIWYRGGRVVGLPGGPPKQAGGGATTINGVTAP